MLRALNTSATGMAAQEKNVSTISNNIANVNTVGFKQERAEFEDLLYDTIKEAGSRSSEITQNNIGLQIGSGAKVTAVRQIHTQGTPQITNNPFDLMINGDGFFGILKENGETFFTRDGQFNVDAQGNLVTRSGDRVFPGITVPPGTSSVNISNTGAVDAYAPNATEAQNIGNIPVFTFMNPAGLKKIGGNLFRITASSGVPQQNIGGTNNAGEINQGALEASNVQIMNEMTNLIKAQRAYEMNSKVMGIADQMLQATNNIR